MKYVVPVVLFALILSVMAKGTHACTCEIFGDGSPRSVIHQAKAVFIGKVLEVRPATKAEREDGSNSYIVRLRVERFWKGIKGSEVFVETDMFGCGPNFEVGQKYLVYGMRKRLETACTGTRKVEDAEEDLKAIGPGKEFKPK